MRPLMVLFAVGITLTPPTLSEETDTWSTCKFYGDPHAKTFDGLYYELQVEGTRTLVKPCCHGNNWFEISAVFYRPYPKAWYTLVKSVSINILGNEVIIVKGPPTQAYYNGGPITTFPDTAGPYVFFKIGTTIYVYISWLYIQVSFNGNLVKIWADKRWLYRLCGKCGEFNGDLNDDDCHVNPLLKRGIGIECERMDEAVSFCQRMIEELTQSCPDLDIEEFMQACVFDECAEPGSASEMSLAVLREECEGNGDNLFMHNMENPPQQCEAVMKVRKEVEGGESDQGKEEREDQKKAEQEERLGMKALKDPN